MSSTSQVITKPGAYSNPPTYAIVPIPYHILRHRTNVILSAIKIEALLDSSKSINLSQELRHFIASILSQMRLHDFEKIPKEQRKLINDAMQVPSKIVEFMDREVGRKMPPHFAEHGWKLLLEVYKDDAVKDIPQCFYALFDEEKDKDEELNFKWGDVSVHLGEKTVALYVYEEGDENNRVSKEKSYVLDALGVRHAADFIRQRVLEGQRQRATQE